MVHYVQPVLVIDVDEVPGVSQGPPLVWGEVERWRNRSR